MHSQSHQQATSIIPGGTEQGSNFMPSVQPLQHSSGRIASSNHTVTCSGSANSRCDNALERDQCVSAWEKQEKASQPHDLWFPLSRRYSGSADFYPPGWNSSDGSVA